MGLDGASFLRIKTLGCIIYARFPRSGLCGNEPREIAP
jgi:hypothetical protein